MVELSDLPLSKENLVLCKISSGVTRAFKIHYFQEHLLTTCFTLGFTWNIGFGFLEVPLNGVVWWTRKCCEQLFKVPTNKLHYSKLLSSLWPLWNEKVNRTDGPVVCFSSWEQINWIIFSILCHPFYHFKIWLLLTCSRLTPSRHVLEKASTTLTPG